MLELHRVGLAAAFLGKSPRLRSTWNFVAQVLRPAGSQHHGNCHGICRLTMVNL
jgi:hypothetical protein